MLKIFLLQESHLFEILLCHFGAVPYCFLYFHLIFHFHQIMLQYLVFHRCRDLRWHFHLNLNFSRDLSFLMRLFVHWWKQFHHLLRLVPIRYFSYLVGHQKIVQRRTFLMSDLVYSHIFLQNSSDELQVYQYRPVHFFLDPPLHQELKLAAQTNF